MITIESKNTEPCRTHIVKILEHNIQITFFHNDRDGIEDIDLAIVSDLQGNKLCSIAIDKSGLKLIK